MTPTMWFWAKGLIGNKVSQYISQLFLTFELLFSVPYNKLIKKLIGYKEYTLDEIDEMLTEKGEAIRWECLDTKFKKFLWKINFPGYGLHLAAWMNYTGKNNIFRRINNYLIKSDMAKNNLLLKLLIGENVDDETINNFKPHEEWIWSQRMTKMNRNRVVPEPGEYQLDKEILNTIKKENLTK